MITDEDKERVRAATDIVQLVGETVVLKQRGQDFWGCCPFHNEKTASFHVMPRTGLFKCFGCGAGGDVFTYVMKRENLDFPDAIRYLADRANIELSEETDGRPRGPRKNRLLEVLAEAESFFHTQLMRGRGEGAAAARAYLAGRGFGSAVCRSWRLGFAPGHGSLLRHLEGKGFTAQEMIAADLAMERNGRLQDRFFDRVMFPIHDERGRTIAFGGRVLRTSDRTAKYLNTRDTSVFNKGKHLFAYDRARESMVATGSAVVCEGYTDVIAMHEAGFTNAVAALGTALRLDHIRLMDRQRVSRIVCMFDGDAAGQRAAERAVQFIDKTPAALLCVVLPNGQDPMEYLSSHEPSEMQDRLDEAVPLMDFVFAKRLAGYDLSTPGLRVRALTDIAQVLAPLKGSVVVDDYASRAADALGVDVGEVLRAIREAPVQQDDAPRSGQKAEPPASVPSVSDVSAKLSASERRQYDAERELVCAIASDADAMRPYAARIGGLTWLDARHESMVWAMLATPAGTPAQDVVAAASAIEPLAPQILASGRVALQGALDANARASLLVDTCELYSLRRQIRGVRAQLAAGGDEGHLRELYAEATRLQARVNELQIRVLGVADA